MTMQTNPEQWAVELWRKACHDYGGMSIEGAWGERNAALTIQAAFAEREARNIAMEKRARDLSVMLVNHLGGGSEWFSQVGDEYYADPKAIGPELQRRKTDAQITKSALVRANRANAEQAEREARLVGAITSTNAMACTPDSDGSHKITLHYPDTNTAIAAFVQLSDVADGGMKDRTNG